MSYHTAKNLEQALNLLKVAGGRARVFAGGTDLFLKPLPEELIDLSKISEALVLKEQQGEITVGACITHATAASSELLKARATVLAKACLQVGSPQVRNLGTLGGNVVNAAPAADAALALTALEARAVIVNTQGVLREEPLENLYRQYLVSAVDSSQEILLKFIFAAQKPGEGSHLCRFAGRRALALPLFSVAAFVRAEEGCLSQVHLVCAPVKPYPTRLPKTEERLKGLPAQEETFKKVAALVREEITVRGSALRCSEDYRLHLAGVLAARALKEAARQAKNSRAGEL